MKLSAKLRLAAGFLAVVLGYTSPAKGDEIIAGQDMVSGTWSSIGGAASSTTQGFSYNLFDSSLGTLNSVTFMIDLKGTGQWMADYGGDGSFSGPVTVTLTGGQAFDMDGVGNDGWIDPANGWNPVVNNVNVSNSVAVQTTAPFWIMSPNDGPAFDWSTGQMFNLPNLAAFIGSGSNLATFSTYGLLSATTNPNLGNIALEGHDYEWKAGYKLIYNYTPVPEPSSALLSGLAFAALSLRRRRRR